MTRDTGMTRDTWVDIKKGVTVEKEEKEGEEEKKEDEKTSIFRKEALKELQTPEQLDKLIQVISPRAWIALFAFYVMLGTVILWGIFGSIPTRVEGKGILLVENGLVYNAVAPTGGGRVAEILVKEGKEVKKGEPLASLEHPDISEKLKLENDYVEKLKSEFSNLKKSAEVEVNARIKQIKDQSDTLNSALQTESKNLQAVQDLLKLKQDNFKKGLVALQDIESTQRDFYAVKDRLQQLQVQLTQLSSQESDFKQQWEQRVKERELNLLAEEQKAKDLASALNVSKTVLSPAAGIVISVNTSVGKIVPEGGSIITITSLGEGLDALTFMLPHEGQRVKPEMSALIAPTNVEKEEYGSMKGKVISVSEFPEAAETIIALLHNEDITKQFVKSGAPIAIRVRVLPNSSTYSGYQWSSSQGPDKRINPGTLADVSITVREQPPISLIIPALKKLLGVS